MTKDTYKVVVSATDCLLGTTVTGHANSGDGRAVDTDKATNRGSRTDQAALSEEAVCLAQL